MLTCQNLSVELDDMTIFRDLGFSLFAGAAMIIDGKNGSGKTTLLETIASIIEPTSGSILFNQVDIRDELSTYRSIMYYAGHKNALDQDCTVFENMKFWALINNSIESLDAAIHVFALEEYMDIEISNLSSGWQKKVSLAKALLSGAILWLLDEPYNGLDHESCAILSEMIKTRCMQGGIVLLTSHKEINDIKAARLHIGDYK